MMLLDIVTITVKAGDGGSGGSTLARTAQTSKGGPDGGNGGNGGSIYAQGSPSIRDLSEFRFKKKIIASHGVSGSSSNKFGKNAPDTLILLPLGTLITDLNTEQTCTISNTTQKYLLAKGGIGGRGNVAFKTATNRTPLYGEPGTPGQEKQLQFDLRLIAEVGLVGMPNAGKSSLLRVLTNATPAVGDYPFTTVRPTIGMLGNHPIADIPGLIEGASKGKGLGMRFLKHIEKTKIVLHCIDVGGNDPEKAYDLVHQEFIAYNSKLQEKPEIIVLTKTDTVTSKKVAEVIGLFQNRDFEVLPLSIYENETITNLKKLLDAKLTK